MSQGQIQLLRLILGAGGDAPDLPLEAVRENFERLLTRFPEVEGVEVSPADLPDAAPGVRAEWVDARPDPSVAPERAVLYLQGGGFVNGTLESHRQMVARFSRAADARCLSLQYRKAPEHPYPAALQDALVAWRGLRESGIPRAGSAVAGESAGAGLAVMLAVRLREAGARLPPALVCFSPWTDYRGSASVDRHAALDPMVSRPGLEKMASYYLGDRDPEDPRLCPLTADLAGLPPMLVQAGESEALLDDAVALHRRAHRAGVPCELEIWPGMIHAWHLFAGRLDDGREAIEAAGQWLRRTLAEREI